MDVYWLDTNVLIEAKNGPYGFEVVPPFWPWILERIESKEIMVSSLVYDEIMKGDDDLKKWMQDNKLRDYCVIPDVNAQRKMSEIANYVHSQYPAYECQDFLNGADPWVISQANVTSGIVATREVLVRNNSRKIKIPNVCNQFTTRWIDSYIMIKKLGGLKF